MRHLMRSAIWILGISALLIAVTIGCPKKSSVDEVTVMLSWDPSGEHAFLYYGIEQGYFANEHLKLKILPSKGSSMVAQALGEHSITFGFISGDMLVMSRVKGLRIKALATLFHESPVCVYSLAKSNISTPHDLIGKRVGVLPQSTTFPQYRAMLANLSIDPDGITEVPSAGSPNEILNGKIDAQQQYTNYAPVQVRALGNEVNELLVKDYGVHIYSTSLAVSEETLNKRRDLARRFMSAFFRSLRDSEGDPDGTLRAFLKQVPGGSEATEAEILKRTNALIFTPDVRSNGLGYMTEQGWDQTQQTVLQARQIDHVIDPAYYFDASFLPGTSR